MRRYQRLIVVVLAAAICCTLGTAVATVGVRHGRPAAGPGTAAAVDVQRGVASLAAVPAAATDRLFAVATFGRSGAAGAAKAQGPLGALGLGVLPLRNLPLALVSGTKAQLQAAVAKGLAADVYPDQRLSYFSAGSTAAIRADGLRAQGLTGRGVGVAIVDTGVDATHPDLADHVTHNLKMIGPEHLDVLGGKHLPDEPPGTIIVPMDSLPYNNSDTTSGHGTHVAGIVAGDAHTSPDQVGVAPDADIIGYGAGDAIQIFTVLAAFDDILTNKDAWGIRVVNNSWGSSGRMFDPGHPINVATKALFDAGIVVVFAAGNDGEEGTINPYSVAPWVISAGSATNSKERSPFSSGGYEHDNSLPVAVPPDRHLHFDGDRIGIYHPDVSAPGTDIVSSGTPTGVGVLAPAAPGGTATLSGTSMAAPHIAGVAALLFQARPSLTPGQVRQVMQVTAVPLAGRAAFWQNGYGFVDATAAAALVRRTDFGQSLLDQLQAAADERVLASSAFRVKAADAWSFNPQPVSVGGTDTRTFDIAVTPETKAVKAVVTYPSLGLVGVNPFDWQITLFDAGGRALATSTASPEAGVSKLFVDLAGAGQVAYGSWKVQVKGVLGAADTDLLIGNVVTLAVAQVQPRAGGGGGGTGPVFVPDASQSLYFQTLSASSAAPLAGALPLPLSVPLAVPSPEGCTLAVGAPQGRMGDGAKATDACATGVVGFAVTHAADNPAEFTSSAPLPRAVTFGGASSLTLWLADAAAPAWTAAAASRVSYTLEAVDGAGKATAVASGDLERLVDAEEVGVNPTRAEYAFEVPPTTVAAGSNLRLRLRFSGAYTATMRLFFGGPYADAGLTLGTGRLE
ncbi:MAG: S8 family peptidase [Acidimicrobiales bacterium]